MTKKDSPSTLEDKETVSTKKAPVKKKHSGGWKNSPVIGNNGLNLEAGDNTKFLSLNLALLNMPNIDMENPEEVQQRLSEYFALYEKADVKPTVAGMAIALNGHSRQWLWCITHNAPLGGRGNTTTLPSSVTDVIKKAYFLLENLWENYMSSGKINPVAGIFLGKNNYGYQDKTEYVLTPNQKQDENYSANDIRERYLASDSQKRLSDSLSDSDSDSDN